MSWRKSREHENRKNFLPQQLTFESSFPRKRESRFIADPPNQPGYPIARV